ncbi:MAG: YCF48-related protein [Candidatus Acidiferrales bacterium]
MPARDDDKAMDGLLRRSLARDAANRGECPDPDILAAYYERSLHADEAAGYEQHIAQCTRCREHLAVLLRAESAVEVPAEQAVVAAAALAPRAKPAGPATISEAERPRHSWIFGWRWLAPAAAVIIFAVFVYTRIAPRESNTLLSKNEVVVSKPEAVPLAAPAQNLSAPAESVQVQRAAPPKPPAAQKSNAAPPPTPAKVQAPPPPPSQPQSSTYAENVQPKAAAPSGARRSSTASGFVGGSMVRGRGAGAGVATQRQPAVGAAAPAREESRNSEQPAAAPPARAVTHAAPAPSTPQPTEAEKEAPPPDSSAQYSRVYPAEKKTDKPATADSSAAAETSSVAERVQTAGSTLSVAVVAGMGPLYRITSDGLVERSNDGGANWQQEHLKTNAPIVGLSAPSGKICWLVGRGGTILLTKNGKSWKKISSPVGIDLIGVTAEDARSATVTAIDGRKFSTVDGGKNWEQLK